MSELRDPTEIYDDGVREGWRRAVDFVARVLAEAQAEPRGIGPTERAGRICALGNLLNDLHAEGGGRT